MVGLQQFNLRWNNYTSNILQVFSEHLSTGSLVDVTLSCQGRFIKAHKIILSACSPYFQEVFANHSDRHPVIILKGIKYEDLQSMIKFMYNGEIKVQETQLDDLLAAAETLQVKGLSNVRSKYERGEITCLNPGPTSVTVKPAESATSKKESPVNPIKATVALFTPTATITRAQNTISTALTLTNSIPTSGNRSQSGNETITAIPLTHTGTLTRIPASTLRAAKIDTRTGTNLTSSIAIATLLPRNTLIPVNQAGNWIRCTSTGAPTSLNFSATNSTAITVSGITKDPAIGASLVSTTSTTPSLATPIITCVTGNFVDPNDNQNAANDFVISATHPSTVSDELQSSTIYTNALTAASTSGTTMTESKAGKEAQPPKTRKRRKTSHIVNELAKETVFASNGTVLLEPDDAVVKSRIKTRSSSNPRTENSETSTEVEEITVKKMRVKIQTKNPQVSLLIKENENHPEKIRRPPNAFMIFANEWRKKLALEHPKENNKKISVRLGIMWKSLSIKAKESYYKLAKKADEDHKERYPDYFYSPKEARIRKSLKHHPLMPTDSAPSLENSEELQTLKAIVNGEEREIVQFSDTDECDDDDEDFEDCEDEEEYDDDVIFEEYTEDEDDDDPDEESQTNSKQLSNKVNSSKT